MSDHSRVHGSSPSATYELEQIIDHEYRVKASVERPLDFARALLSSLAEGHAKAAMTATQCIGDFSGLAMTYDHPLYGGPNKVVRPDKLLLTQHVNDDTYWGLPARGARAICLEYVNGACTAGEAEARPSHYKDILTIVPTARKFDEESGLAQQGVLLTLMEWYDPKEWTIGDIWNPSEKHASAFIPLGSSGETGIDRIENVTQAIAELFDGDKIDQRFGPRASETSSKLSCTLEEALEVIRQAVEGLPAPSTEFESTMALTLRDA